MTGYKNYGPDVSETPQDLTSGGSYAAEEHAFETIVIQADKPVIDWEMNLRNQVSSLGSQNSNQAKYPTCWLNGDFLESPNANFDGSYIFLNGAPGTENKFQLRASDLVVNGWDVRFEYSGTTTPGINVIQLPTPPVAGTRTDLVILEVWRALINPAPDAANKSATSLIVRHGNIKAPDGVNLADDLIDPTEAAPTALRVQIQYRFRAIPNINTDGYPDGLDDPAVFANTVSDFSGPGADGSVTGYNYVKHATDSGLWVAGNGTAGSATVLGTVDGYMYATPICAVFRRNLTAFNRTANLNGGTTIASGTSSRPDGLFADEIAPTDIRDLRRGVALDLQEVLQKTVQQIFDNSLSTHQETYNGLVGAEIFSKDDIGVGSTSFGNPDGIRRFFSDRSITESIVAEATVSVFSPTSLVYNLSSLKLPWNSTNTNILLNAPTNTNIVGISKIRRVDSTNTDAIATGVIDKIIYSVNIGPGVDQVELQFTSNQANINFQIELLVEYTRNNGASRNIRSFNSIYSPPAASIQSSWSYGLVDTTLLIATPDAFRFRLDPSIGFCEPGHREAAIKFRTTPIVSSYRSDNDIIYIPERVVGSININDGINPPYVTSTYEITGGFTLVTLSPSIPDGTNVSATFRSYRPAPIVSAAPGESHQFYYQSAAMQAITPPAGVQTINLIPRVIDQNLYVIIASSGSPDNPFPFVNPSEQLPVGALPSPDYPEAYLDNPAQLNLVGSGINTGFVRLPLVVPYSPNSSQVQFFREAIDQVQDGELRGFWPRSQNPADANQKYSAVLFSQNLLNSQNHKVAVPVLMELKEDFPSIGRKGQLVLVMYTNWIDFSINNKIEFQSSLSSSAASIFRINGNMLNGRRNS